MTDIRPSADDRPSTPELHLVEPDASVPDIMDAFAILRFQNSRVVAAFAADHGISPADFRALFFIASREDATPKRVAEHLGLTTGAMTTLVDRLESAGFARRAPNPRDRRSLLLSLSERGQSLVDEAGQTYHRAFDDAIDAAHRAVVLEAFLALGRQLRDVGDQLERGERK